MRKRNLFLTCFLVLLVSSRPAIGDAPGLQTDNSCVRCHSGLPESDFVGMKSHSWTGSTHQTHGVTCDECHGGNPQAAGRKEAHLGVLGSGDPNSPVYFKNIPSTCGKCHGAEFYKFSQSLHSELLASTGKGPTCVTCHGSMVTHVLAPDTIAAVCERCHNEKSKLRPYIPGKAEAVLLLLRESKTLLYAETEALHPPEGSPEAQALHEAALALYSARLDWHRFDLDAITDRLEVFFNLLRPLPSDRPGP